MALTAVPNFDSAIDDLEPEKLSERSAVLHRSSRERPLHVASAKGCNLVLDNGQIVLDAAAGAAVACLGHNDERVQQAIVEQMEQVSYAHSQVYTATGIEELARILIRSTDGKMSHAVFMSSGSEATEVAMKLARQYHLEKSPPEPQRDIFLSRQHSYHGATLAGLALSGHIGRQARYKPFMLPNMIKTEPCHAYRFKKDNESDEMYVARLAATFEDDIKACGADRVCAFFAETVSGSSLAAAPPVRGYFEAVRRICDKYGVLLILDEIMCGVGRTGTMHAWQQEGISPDIQTMGKGLGGGYAPIAAVLMNRRVYKALDDGSGAFSHGQTYQSHLLACATALKVQQLLQEDSLVQASRDKGAYFKQALEVGLGKLDHVGDIRGRGLFVGIELVLEKTSKEPFPALAGVAAGIHARALDRGVATYPGRGTADGVRGDHILLAPPFVISKLEMDEVVRVLRDVIADVTTTAAAPASALS